MGIVRKLFALLVDFMLPRNDVDIRVERLNPEDVNKCALEDGKAMFGIFAVLDYRRGGVKDLIWSLKYRKNERAAELLANAISEHLLDELGELAWFSNFQNPILIPIPLSKGRFRRRGYNQTEILARSIFGRMSDYVKGIDTETLVKVMDTKPQTSLKREERMENLKGAFAVSRTSAVAGKNIILIDDVATTGATLGEASFVLKKAGARKVFCVAAAH